MNTVLMCGYESGNETVNMLFAAIRSAHEGAFHITDEAVSIIPPKSKSPAFIVIDNDNIRNVHTAGGVALFRKQAQPKQHAEIPPAFLAVVDSDNKEAIGMLRNDGIQTISCGLSQKDTMTFSSLENDRAVVSLQRGLKALDGTDIVPVEVPVRFGMSRSEYPVLAAVAVLLLAGVQIPDGGLVLI